MRPETALVAALARGDAEGVERALHRQPRTDAVLEWSASQRVDGLCSWMWRHVVASAERPRSIGLPAALERGLWESYVHHELRNESLLNDLGAVTDSLLARGVQALVLKGPWLAFHAYPSPGARSMIDIDLCVPETDYHGAVDALRAQGYGPRGPLPATPASALSRAHYREQFWFDVRGRRPVELHFRMINFGPPQDEAWVWQTARTIDVGGCRMTVPGPEAMLLHLLLHANQHGFAILRNLHDIRWALDRDGAAPGSATFTAGVRRLRCAASVYHSLLLAREIAGADVSDTTLHSLRPSGLRCLLFRCFWRLGVARKLDLARRPAQVESPRFFLLEVGRLRDKARYLRGVLRESDGAVPLLLEAVRVVSRSDESATRRTP